MYRACCVLFIVGLYFLVIGCISCVKISDQGKGSLIRYIISFDDEVNAYLGQSQTTPIRIGKA